VGKAGAIEPSLEYLALHGQALEELELLATEVIFLLFINAFSERLEVRSESLLMEVINSLDLIPDGQFKSFEYFQAEPPCPNFTRDHLSVVKLSISL
jgi:predicted RNase H-like HicB family nuclease